MQYPYPPPEPDEVELQSRNDEFGDDIRAQIDDVDGFVRWLTESERINDAGQGPHPLGPSDAAADKGEIVDALRRFIDPDPVFRGRPFEWHLARWALQPPKAAPAETVAWLNSVCRPYLDGRFVLERATLGDMPAAAVLRHIEHHIEVPDCLRLVGENLPMLVHVVGMQRHLPFVIAFMDRVGLLDESEKAHPRLRDDSPEALAAHFAEVQDHARERQLMEARRKAIRTFIDGAEPSERLALLRAFLRATGSDSDNWLPYGWRHRPTGRTWLGPAELVRGLLAGSHGPGRAMANQLGLLAASSDEAHDIVGSAVREMRDRAPDAVRGVLRSCPTLIHFVLTNDDFRGNSTPPDWMKAIFGGQADLLAAAANLPPAARFVLAVLINDPAAADIVQDTLKHDAERGERQTMEPIPARLVSWAADHAQWVPAQAFVDFVFRSGQFTVLSMSKRLQRFVRLSPTTQARLRSLPLGTLGRHLDTFLAKVLEGMEIPVADSTDVGTLLPLLCASGTEASFQRVLELLKGGRATPELLLMSRVPLTWWARWFEANDVSPEFVHKMLTRDLRTSYFGDQVGAPPFPVQLVEPLLEVVEKEAAADTLAPHFGAPSRRSLRWAGDRLRSAGEDAATLRGHLQRLIAKVEVKHVADILVGILTGMPDDARESFYRGALDAAHGAEATDWASELDDTLTEANFEHQDLRAEEDKRHAREFDIEHLSDEDLDACFDGLTEHVIVNAASAHCHSETCAALRRAAVFQLRRRLLAATQGLDAPTRERMVIALGERFPNRETLDELLQTVGVDDAKERGAILDRCADERLPRVFRVSLEAVFKLAVRHWSPDAKPLTVAAACVGLCLDAYANQPSVVARAFSGALSAVAHSADERAVCGLIYGLGELRENATGKVPRLLGGLSKDETLSEKVRSTAHTQKRLFDRENIEKGRNRKAERRVQNAAASLRRGLAQALAQVPPTT